MVQLLIALWLVFSAGVYYAEMGIEGAPIQSYGDALYWADSYTVPGRCLQAFPNAEAKHGTIPLTVPCPSNYPLAPGFPQ